MSVSLKDSRKLSFDVSQSNFDLGNLTPAEAADISAAFCKAVELGCQAVAIATGNVFVFTDAAGNNDYVAKLPCDKAVEVVKNTGLVKNILAMRGNAKVKPTTGLTGAVARFASGRLQKDGDTFVISSNNIEITLTLVVKTKGKFDSDEIRKLAGESVSVHYANPALAHIFSEPFTKYSEAECQKEVLDGNQAIAALYKADSYDDIDVAFRYLEKKGEE